MPRHSSPETERRPPAEPVKACRKQGRRGTANSHIRKQRQVHATPVVSSRRGFVVCSSLVRALPIIPISQGVDESGNSHLPAGQSIHVPSAVIDSLGFRTPGDIRGNHVANRASVIRCRASIRYLLIAETAKSVSDRAVSPERSQNQVTGIKRLPWPYGESVTATLPKLATFGVAGTLKCSLDVPG